MGRIPSMLKEMTVSNIKPNIITYSTIIKGYCQVSKVDKAFELLEELKQNTDIVPDEVTYNTLLDGCARFSTWEHGMKVFKEMQAAGLKPSNFTLCVLVKLANRCNRPEQAFKLTEELCAKHNIRLNVQVFNNLIHVRTVGKDLEAAMQVLERMLREKVRPDARTYKLLVRGCIAAKAPIEVAGLLRGAVGFQQEVHPVLARFPRQLVQPVGGLTTEVVTEAIEGIALHCQEEVLAVQLLRDLRGCPGVHLDPRLPLKLTRAAQQQA